MTNDRTLVIVGCGAAKRDSEAPAKDLYTSTYFQKKRAYAETIGDDWQVLSAEHGLVPADFVIKPYETHIDDLDDRELDLLAHSVGMDLINICTFDEIDDVRVLAGRSYLDPLREREAFATAPATVRFPLQEADCGGIGEQMQWLDERVAAYGEQQRLVTDGGQCAGDTDQEYTSLRQRGIRKRMRCSGQAAKRIEDTFVTVEQLVDAVESDQELTEYDGIGPKTAEVIEDWWDNRFDREERMDSGSVERTGSKSATIHFHNSWSAAIGDRSVDTGTERSNKSMEGSN